MSLSNTVLTKSGRVWRHPGWRCALVVTVLGLGAPQMVAQCIEEQKLIASDAAGLDFFGSSVSVSGDTAVVGAVWNDCAAGNACGSAYVIRFDGTSWVEEQKLIASDAAAGDEFGASVSVSGDTLVVGARKDDCARGINCGSVYVFRFNGTDWVEEQKLTPSDAGGGDRFGFSVSMSREMALVGARFDDCSAGINCGSAYVYRFNGTGWVEEQKLTATDAAASDHFGSSVSVRGETVAVGATSDDCTAGFNCGSAYVFRFNGLSWIEEQKLIASDAAAEDEFGRSISLGMGTVVVGAFRDVCAAGDNCGSAYVYRFNGTTWVHEQKLTASDAKRHDWFGISVSVSADTVLVGANHNDCLAAADCGAAYVFSCAVAPTVVTLDIKPGSCPNPVNPRSKGVVPVALVGSINFDVATIDPDSLTLARADGAGGSVAPLSDRRGPGIVIEDVATPFSEEPCGCHELGGDGIDDLSLKFSTSEMNRTLELNTLSRGETIGLVLRGTLHDGTTFEGLDCIVIPGRQGNLRGILRTSKSK